MNYLKRLLPFAKPYRFAILLTMLFTAGGLITNLDRAADAGPRSGRGRAMKDMNAVVLYCGLLVGIAALRSLFYYLQGVWQGTVGADIVRDLRNALYRKLQRLPFSYYTTMPTGQIMSRMLGDMDAIEQFVAFGFTAMVTEISTFVFTLIVLLALDWQLTLMVLAPMTLMYFPIARFRLRLDPAWDAVREQMGRLTSVLQENVSGVRVVKAFGREGYAVTQFERENALNRQKNVDRGLLEARAFPTMDFHQRRVVSGAAAGRLAEHHQWHAFAGHIHRVHLVHLVADLADPPDGLVHQHLAPGGGIVQAAVRDQRCEGDDHRSTKRWNA